MTSRNRKSVFFVVGSVVLALVISLAVFLLQYREGHRSSPETVSMSAESGVVTPAVKDVDPVLVVDSQVSATPNFEIWTASRGTLKLSVRSGGVVKAGATVATLDGKPLKSPVDGNVQWVANAGSSDVPKNYPFVRIAYAGFAAPVQIAASDGYRLSGTPTGALISLTNGASGTSCDLVKAASTDRNAVLPAQSEPTGGQQSSESSESSSSQWPPTYCLIRKDTEAFSGQHAKIGIQFPSIKNALTVPLLSVTGSSQVGVVQLCNQQGERGETRRVKLGATDGTDVVVTGGITASDLICAIPPAFGVK